MPSQRGEGFTVGLTGADGIEVAVSKELAVQEPSVERRGGPISAAECCALLGVVDTTGPARVPVALRVVRARLPADETAGLGDADSSFDLDEEDLPTLPSGGTSDPRTERTRLDVGHAAIVAPGGSDSSRRSIVSCGAGRDVNGIGLRRCPRCRAGWGTGAGGSMVVTCALRTVEAVVELRPFCSRDDPPAAGAYAAEATRVGRPFPTDRSGLRIVVSAVPTHVAGGSFETRVGARNSGGARSTSASFCVSSWDLVSVTRRASRTHDTRDASQYVTQDYASVTEHRRTERSRVAPGRIAATASARLSSPTSSAS
jgi:hypothetical protein